MNQYEFSNLNVGHLSNDEAANLYQWTGNVAEGLKAGIGVMPNAGLVAFTAKTQPLIDQNNRLRENPITGLLKDGRKVNEDLWSEIKRNVTFELKSRSEARKADATDLNIFYKPYWDLSSLPLGKHIQDTDEMSVKYQADATLVAKGSTVGVNTAMGELISNNANMRSLYLTRNEQEGGRGVSGTDLRPEANEGYIQFCNVVEQSLNLMPSESLLTLFNSMNELRAKAHALLS